MRGARTAAVVATFTVLAALATATQAAAAAGAVPPPPSPGPSQPLRTSPAAPQYASGHVLVRFRPGVGAAQMRRSLAAVTSSSAPATGVEATGVLQVPVSGDPVAAVAALREDPGVSAASLDYVRTATSITPNDPLFGSQSYLKFTLRLPDAWSVTQGSTATTVAVVDSGVDLGHPDLAGRLVAGHDFVDGDATPQDANGHGTEVAGIIGARGNNAAGVAGIDWAARIMPVRVLNAQGSGYDSDVIAGIEWAADHGAGIVNLSLGGTADDPLVRQAVQYARSKGALVVAASGNDGKAEAFYPAAYPEVVAVTATNGSTPVYFSNTGSYVDLAAPGWNITSTALGGGYATGGAGTSFAAPIVSGVAALVHAAHPSWTWDQVVHQMEATAVDRGTPGRDDIVGYGVVDAGAAVGADLRQEYVDDPADDGGSANDLPRYDADCPPNCSLTGSGGGVGLEYAGDADWKAYGVSTPQLVTVQAVVDPASQTSPTAALLRVSVYDSTLGLVASKAATALNQPVSVSVNLGAGSFYVRLTNDLTSATGYTFVNVSAAAPTGTPPTPSTFQWVIGREPATDLNRAGPGTAPSATFLRALAPATVSASTVHLLDDWGQAVAGAVTYESGTQTVRFTPSATLRPGGAYHFVVDGVTDLSSNHAPPYQAAFRVWVGYSVTAAVTGLTVSGGLAGRALLSWTDDDDPALAGVAIRYLPGDVAPTTSTGTGLQTYGSSLSVPGLAFGQDYTFLVYGEGFGLSTGPSTTITLKGAAVAVAASPTTLPYGQAETTTVTVTDPVTHAAAAGRSVHVYWRAVGATAWTALGTGSTGAQGQVSVLSGPHANVQYEATVDAVPGSNGGLSPTLTVPVSYVLPSRLSTLTPALGQTVVWTAGILPLRVGHPVYLQDRYHAAWRTIATVLVPATGRFSFGIKPATRGAFAYRLYTPADTSNAAGFTASVVVTVH